MVAVTNRRPDAGWRGFNTLWGATAASNLSDGILLVSMPLLAARIGGTPAAVGAVAFLAGLPWLLTPLAGVVADRVNRQKLVVAANVARGLVVWVLAILLFLDVVTLPVLLGTAFVLGIVEVVVDTGNETMLPGTVTDESIETAIRRMRVTLTAANLFVGPGFAGLLFATGHGLPFGIVGTCYILCAALQSRLVGDYHHEAAEKVGQWVADLKEGVKWFAGHRLLLRLAVMLAVIVGCQSMAMSQLVLFAVQPGPMGLRESQYGLLGFAGGVGSLLAGLAQGRLAKLVGRANLLRACALGGAVMFGIPALTHSIPLVAVGLFLGGAAEMIWVVIVRSISQVITPMDMLGRIGSLYTLIAWGFIPIGAAAGAAVGTHWGLRTVFAVAGSVTLVLGAILLAPLKEAQLATLKREDAGTSGQQ